MFLFILLVLIVAATSIHLPQSHKTIDFRAGSVNLMADNGQYLDACFECGKGIYAFSASVSNYPQAWKLQIIGEKVAFKSNNGKYLSRCKWCWKQSSAKYDDAVFVHISTASSADPWALWTPELQSNGKYAFKADNGNYLARCNGCVGESNQLNFAFVHSTNAGDSVAQWILTYTDKPKFNTPLSIIADNYQQLQACFICAYYNPNFIPVRVENRNRYENSIWVIEQLSGGKVALKTNGKYLSRCNGCLSGAAYDDSAFAYLDNHDPPYAKWKAVKQENGRWTFQADNGNYLARCYGCGASSDKNYAFVHTNNPLDPVAQWILYG